MNVTGIIAEYNPFHKGHHYHINESRSKYGEKSSIICIMSGNFVQRGQAALFNKYARAKAAVLCGADLVLELPLPWSLSSAEGFARGAVSILGKLGAVSSISFGSECGDVSSLEILAAALLSPEIDSEIKTELKSHVSYARARQNVIARKSGSAGELSGLLETPNNILAVEYLKAISSLDLNISPMTMKRRGAAHDGEGHGEFRSASALRSMISSGEDFREFVPAQALQVFQEETDKGRGPVDMRCLETAMLSRLRMLKLSDFHSLPDNSEGLSDRIYKAVKTEASVSKILESAKTKRYAMSRLRRMLMCAALGLTADKARGLPPYTRLLGANKQGCRILKSVKKSSGIPIITKPASAEKLDDKSRHLFELECSAADFYTLAYENTEERKAGSDWRQSPFIAEF